MLRADQADDLRRLLGTVEDWLLHTCFEVRDDLGEFLVGLGCSGAGPEQLVTWLINDLGEHTITLRRATTASTAPTRTVDRTASP